MLVLSTNTFAQDVNFLTKFGKIKTAKLYDSAAVKSLIDLKLSSATAASTYSVLGHTQTASTITDFNTTARSLFSFVAGSGAYNSTTGAITIPTNTNQLTNGAGYLLSYTETDPIVRAINGIVFSNGTTISAATQTNITALLGAGSISNTMLANTAVATLSGTNSGDNATNTQYSGLAASKENTITAGTTAQYWRGDKSWQTLDKIAVGLANVDNTSDANKPVSTAQATAIGLKANIASPTFTGTVGLPAGQVVNGVTLTTAGTTANFLNASGTYTAPPTAAPTNITYTPSTTTGAIASSTGTGATIALADATNSGLFSAAEKTKLAGITTGASVSSVAAITLGTTGTDLSSTVATGTTTPVITLNVPTASAANRGALSSTDWSTFNGKLATNGSGAALTGITAAQVGAQPLNTNLTSIGGLANASGVLTNNGTGTFTYVPAATGTVTAIGVTTTNGVSGTSSGGATPNLTIALGAITPSSTNGVSAATMAFMDATSSVQTQLNNRVISNTAITGATFPKVTYDAKGLVTAGAALIAGDIPNIAEGQVTNLVADLASKEPTITVLSIAKGGTGSATQNFIDLTTAQIKNVGVTANTTPLLISGSINDFFQHDIKNTSTGTAAQSGYSATADNGTATTNFLWNGKNNSAFNNPQTYNVGAAGDGSVLNDGGNFWLHNTSLTGKIAFSTGNASTPFYTERMAVNGNGSISFNGAVGTAGQVLQSNGAAAPTWVTVLPTRATIAASAAINTTATYIAPTTFSIPANSMVAGDSYRMTIYGTNTSTVGGANTFTPRMGALGTTADAALSGLAVTSAVTGTAVPFRVTFTFTARAVGAAGSIYCYGVLENQGITGISTAAVVVNTGGVTTINTTGTLTLGCSLVTAAITTTDTIQSVVVEKM